jgi:flavin-binding protein dodecin
MSIAKVIEIISEGKTVEAAVEASVAQATKSVRNVRSVNVKNIQARVVDGKVSEYRVICKVSFIVE